MSALYVCCWWFFFCSVLSCASGCYSLRISLLFVWCFFFLRILYSVQHHHAKSFWISNAPYALLINENERSPRNVLRMKWGRVCTLAVKRMNSFQKLNSVFSSFLSFISPYFSIALCRNVSIPLFLSLSFFLCQFSFSAISFRSLPKPVFILQELNIFSVVVRCQNFPLYVSPKYHIAYTYTHNMFMFVAAGVAAATVVHCSFLFDRV